MGLLSDLKVLYHLTMKPIRGKDHASRMESFYGGQAEAYDSFRKRLLKGREELWQWAIAHWDTNAVPAQRMLPAPEQYSGEITQD